MGHEACAFASNFSDLLLPWDPMWMLAPEEVGPGHSVTWLWNSQIWLCHVFRKGLFFMAGLLPTSSYSLPSLQDVPGSGRYHGVQKPGVQT